MSGLVYLVRRRGAVGLLAWLRLGLPLSEETAKLRILTRGLRRLQNAGR